MIRLLLIPLCAITLSSQAFAYKDGTYVCKNRDGSGLPSNRYTFKTVQMGAATPAIFVESISYFYLDGADASREPQHSTVSGFAMHVESPTLGETVALGSLTFQFDKNDLLNCRVDSSAVEDGDLAQRAAVHR